MIIVVGGIVLGCLTPFGLSGMALFILNTLYFIKQLQTTSLSGLFYQEDLVGLMAIVLTYYVFILIRASATPASLNKVEGLILCRLGLLAGGLSLAFIRYNTG